MVKKKVKEDSSVQISFDGGPRDGTTMRVLNPPPPRLRLAFPEWCNYYQVGNSSVYEYNMEIPWVTVNALKNINSKN